MISIREEVDVYANRVDLFRQSVSRPTNVGPWNWQQMWRKEEDIDSEVYMDRVVLFGSTVFRPPRISPSQWYAMWGDPS